jgi:hypothetical protein
MPWARHGPIVVLRFTLTPHRGTASDRPTRRVREYPVRTGQFPSERGSTVCESESYRAMVTDGRRTGRSAFWPIRMRTPRRPRCRGARTPAVGGKGHAPKLGGEALEVFGHDHAALGDVCFNSFTKTSRLPASPNRARASSDDLSVDAPSCPSGWVARPGDGPARPAAAEWSRGAGSGRAAPPRPHRA